MQRGVGFLGNQVGLLVPVEVVTDGNSKVFCLRDGAQDCPTHLIKLVQSASPGYVIKVALTGVEGHAPADGPVVEIIKVLLKNGLVVLILD